MSLTFEIIPQIILFIPLIVFAVLLILQRRWGMLQTGSGFVAVSSGEKVVGWSIFLWGCIAPFSLSV
jgi:hypothetical protein